MRVLLDNCVPIDLAVHIRGHEVVCVTDLGWAHLDDGALLDAADGGFDILVTADKGIPFQQLLAGRSIAVVVMRARNNRVGTLARLIPALLTVLKSIAPGEVLEIG